jgi:hypothetical protein
MKKTDFCYFHEAQRERRLRIQREEKWTKPFQLPLLEDANAVQIAIMDIANAYLADRIDHKKASLLLYALQTAASNASRLTFANEEDESFIAYEPVDYVDHDNAVAHEGEIASHLPPRLDAASESCDPDSAQQGEFGGVTVG